MEPNADYVSYMLRLRRMQDNDHLVWVASIQSTATGEQQPFADLVALVEYLLAEFGGGK